MNVFRLFMLLLAAVSSTGCGRGSGRTGVEGIVAVDGAPLETGAIRFVPEEDTKGPTAGGEISNGRFSISAAGGPLPGAYRVEITASRPGTLKVLDEVSGQMVAVSRQYLPEHYNDRSTLRVDIRQGGPPLEFRLESR
ncbi:MAG: hypothetical protein K8S94_15300 [Planctomycetia bacterium]|nr:hypothetical protein [Planctomycetia bacterium]